MQGSDAMMIAPIELDGVLFVPGRGDHERALCCYSGFEVGEIGFDDEKKCPKARKLSRGETGPWRVMRCQAEARAFIVSRIRE